MIRDDFYNFEFGFVIEPPNLIRNNNRVLIWIDSSIVKYVKVPFVTPFKYQLTKQEKLDNIQSQNYTG